MRSLRPAVMPSARGSRVRRLRTAQPLAVLSLLCIACGGGEGGESGSAAATASSPPEIDTCAILAEIDVAAVLGGPGQPPVEAVRGGDQWQSVSQCVVGAADGSTSLGLLVRWSSRGVPTSRAEFIEQERSGADAMGMGQEVEQALSAAEDVPGLGDVAIFYELISHNLVVAWDGEYTMNVSVGIPDRAAALTHARMIAERVIAKF